MEFALFTDLQLPRPWQPGSEAQLIAQSLEQAQLGDRLGFDCVWAQEHHFLEEYSHSSAPEVFLGALASTTKHIRLGHGITVMLPRINHPVRVAERIAMLDVLSGGRVEWGTGESSTRMELEPYGVTLADKRAMWSEAVREATRMLALEPYPGCEGEYISMPARNIVPKPLQRPHPPLWMACSNRDSLRLAARLGLGALTFAFIDAKEARFWVEEYYDVFQRECTPLGLSVNPRLAMLSGFMCHHDGDIARQRGLEGAQFFGFGLMHYWREGSHVPAETDLWKLFKSSGGAAQKHMAGTQGIGSPQTIRDVFREFEEAGIDQLILLQQAGNYEHGAICESLELFAQEVMPEFKEREVISRARRREALAPYVAAALERTAVTKSVPSPAVETYATAWSNLMPTMKNSADRRPGAAAFWRAQVMGVRSGETV